MGQLQLLRLLLLRLMGEQLRQGGVPRGRKVKVERRRRRRHRVALARLRRVEEVLWGPVSEATHGGTTCAPIRAGPWAEAPQVRGGSRRGCCGVDLRHAVQSRREDAGASQAAPASAAPSRWRRAQQQGGTQRFGAPAHATRGTERCSQGVRRGAGTSQHHRCVRSTPRAVRPDRRGQWRGDCIRVGPGPLSRYRVDPGPRRDKRVHPGPRRRGLRGC